MQPSAAARGGDGAVFGFVQADERLVGQARFNFPEDAVEAPDGAIYISDTQANIMRRMKNGTVTVFAGSFRSGYYGVGPA